MPLAPFSGRPGAKVRRMAAQYTIKGIRMGLSGNAILESLRSAGLGYRTQEFYRDFNYFSSIPMRLPTKLSGIGSLILPETIYTEMPTIGPHRYKYNFNVAVTNKITGETEMSMMSTISPDRISPYSAWSNLSEGLFRSGSIEFSISDSSYVDAQEYQPQ